MGADDFATRARGKTAAEAFDKAVESALYEHGHGGYTGTIAEKHSFVMITAPEGVRPEIYGRALNCYVEAGMKLPAGIDEKHRAKFTRDSSAVQDKWGPAGCIQLTDGSFLFFGLASS